MQAAFNERASVPEYTTAAARLAPEPLISSSGCSGRSRWYFSVHLTASQDDLQGIAARLALSSKCHAG